MFFANHSGEKNEKSIATTPVWKVGQTKDYHISVTTEYYQNNYFGTGGYYTSDIKMKILAATEKSYDIEWVYKNVNVEKLTPDAAENFLVQLSEGRKVIYSVTKSGKFIKIKNLKEIRDFHTYKIDKMIAKNDQNTDLMKQMKTLFSTEKAIENLVISEIKMYHQIYGFEFNFNSETAAEIHFDNLITGVPIPANIVLKVGNINPAGNSIKIEETQKVNQKKSKKIFEQIIKRINEYSGEDRKIKNYDIFYNLVYDYDPVSTYIKSMMITKTDIQGRFKTVHTTVFK